MTTLPAGTMLPAWQMVAPIATAWWSARYAVAAVPLGAIERLVGGGEQCLGGICGGRNERGYAGAHRHATAGRQVGQRLYPVARRLGQPDRAGRIRRRQQQRELLAAVAGDQIVGPARHGGERVRHPPQASVSGQVAKGVVVGFEEVDVEQDERQRRAGAAAVFPFPRQALVQ